MDESSLRYSDERDKSYGIAGMAITLVALDGLDYLEAVDLDAEPGHTMVMAHSFGLQGNPRMSAKIVWEQTVRELRLTTSMVLGNIACRRRIGAGVPVKPADTTSVREAVRAEASGHCGLDDDEADALFRNCYDYVDRIFRHSALPPVVHGFVDKLAEQRSMSAAELSEILAQLGLR